MRAEERAKESASVKDEIERSTHAHHLLLPENKQPAIEKAKSKRGPCLGGRQQAC